MPPPAPRNLHFKCFDIGSESINRSVSCLKFSTKFLLPALLSIDPQEQNLGLTIYRIIDIEAADTIRLDTPISKRYFAISKHHYSALLEPAQCWSREPTRSCEFAQCRYLWKLNGWMYISEVNQIVVLIESVVLFSSVLSTSVKRSCKIIHYCICQSEITKFL